jgi:hypothetical protein
MSTMQRWLRRRFCTLRPSHEYVSRPTARRSGRVIDVSAKIDERDEPIVDHGELTSI